MSKERLSDSARGILEKARAQSEEYLTDLITKSYLVSAEFFCKRLGIDELHLRKVVPSTSHTWQELHDATKARGGECLTLDYAGVDGRHRFRCAQGHEWETTFRKVVMQGTWCSKCSGRRPDKSERFAQAVKVTRDKGGELLSGEYRNTDAPLRWRCSAGHEWETSFDCVVRRGQWCAQCAGRKVSPVLQLERAQTYTAEKGGLCLSEAFVSSHRQMVLQCSLGHTWEGTFSNIVFRGKWCPWCAGNKVDSEVQLQRARDTARARGGELLSLTYPGNKVLLSWWCAHQLFSKPIDGISSQPSIRGNPSGISAIKSANL